MNNKKLAEELVKLAERVVKGWILVSDTVKEAVEELKGMIDGELYEMQRLGDDYDTLLTPELLEKAINIIDAHKHDFADAEDVDEIANLLFDQPDFKTDEERDEMRAAIEEGLDNIDVDLS